MILNETRLAADQIPKIVVSRSEDTSDAGVFVFELIDSAIAKGAAEIVLSLLANAEEVRVEFGFSNSYYRQPGISPTEFSYVVTHLPHIANRLPDGEFGNRLFAAYDRRFYHLRFANAHSSERNPAISIGIERMNAQSSG